MKVHFDGVNFGSLSGPNTFASRLARKLFESGHELVLEGPKADVSLVFIERSGRPLAQKVVQRLDGIWFKPEEFAIKNSGIYELYMQADAVVWQSDFDRDMTTRWWNVPKGVGEVIRNGIDTTPLTELTIPALSKMVQDYERIYVCSSNWHPQKRLRANVELFERLNARRPNSCLIIMGKDPDVRTPSRHIFFTGPVGPDVYMQVYAAASWMLHLAWADHCPNVVIEALSQGTPVVCSSVGGTKELIGTYGKVLQDQPYDFELADYDNPPVLDLSQIDDLPDRSELNYSSIADINIDNVAQRYVKLFERVLK